MEISIGVSYIDRSIQLIITDNLKNIVGLGISGISGTKMTLKVLSETAGTEEYFNIASLAVADNEETIFLCERYKSLFQIRIERGAAFKERQMFFLTALVDEP